MVSSRRDIIRLRFPVNARSCSCDRVVLGYRLRWTGFLAAWHWHTSIFRRSLCHCTSCPYRERLCDSCGIPASPSYVDGDILRKRLYLTRLLRTFDWHFTELGLRLCHRTYPSDCLRYRGCLGLGDILMFFDDHGYRFDLRQCLRLLLYACFGHCSCMMVGNRACLDPRTRIFCTRD